MLVGLAVSVKGVSGEKGRTNCAETEAGVSRWTQRAAQARRSKSEPLVFVHAAFCRPSEELAMCRRDDVLPEATGGTAGEANVQIEKAFLPQTADLSMAY